MNDRRSQLADIYIPVGNELPKTGTRHCCLLKYYVQHLLTDVANGTNSTHTQHKTIFCLKVGN